MPTADNHIPLQELIPAIIDRLPAILAELQELLAEQHPDYAGFLAAQFEEVLDAAERFVARPVGLARPEPTTMTRDLQPDRYQSLFEEIGRNHYQQQREVTPLLAAYRTGAAVAWRHVAETALQLGVPAEAFVGLAAAVFAAVEQLSLASLTGYAQAQTGHARERRRDELAELLLSDRCDTATVRAAAVRTGWPLPQQAAVVLITSDGEVGRTPLNRLDDSCLRLRRGQMFMAIVPDPEGPGRRTRLATALRGAAAVVGATVPLDRLPASVDLAQLALRLQQLRVLLTAVRHHYLAPLAALPNSTRARLSATLRSWLMNMGNRKAVADELHVHPQTVRYRLGQLRELFGTALEDPAIRAALLLALAWDPAAIQNHPQARHEVTEIPPRPSTIDRSRLTSPLAKPLNRTPRSHHLQPKR